MILTPLPNRDNIWHPLNAQNEIERMVVNGELSQPKILETIKTTSPQHYNLVYTTISGLFRYLKNCLKF